MKGKGSSIYQYPRYYALAYSYRDIPLEVRVMQSLMEQHGADTPAQVLEVACGHGPHATEWARRGYGYTGIDLNPAMLTYAMAQNADIGEAAQFVRGDLVDFNVAEPVGLAYTLSGSLYVKDRDELDSHFASMARAVAPGGLYLLEWCIEFDPFIDVVDTWVTDADGVHIDGTYATRWVNRIEQTVEETIRFDVQDSGARHTLEQKTLRLALFPQEFLAYVADRTAFEFVGWWDRWDLEQPITGDVPVVRPVTVLRRVEY